MCPGDTYVPHWDERAAAVGRDVEEDIGTFARNIPLGGVGTADKIAQAVLFPASDASSFMTGAALIIDGGYTAWEKPVR